MKGPLSALLLASATLVAMPAQADVYKCTINGETRYQDEPCPGARDAAPHLEFKPDPTPAPAPVTEAQPMDQTPVSSPPIDGPPMDSPPKDSPPRSRADMPAESPSPGSTREEPRIRRVRTQPAPPPPDDDSPLDRPAQLGVDIASAEQELRAVVDERREALAAIDVRMAAGGNNNALAADRRQLEARYRERRLEVSGRLARLRAELADVCPNGTFQNVHRLACR